MTEISVAEALKAIMVYAAIGQAAMLGMFISGILLVGSLLGLPISMPLAGFITVPLACLWFGYKGLKK